MTQAFCEPLTDFHHRTIGLPLGSVTYLSPTACVQWPTDSLGLWRLSSFAEWGLSILEVAGNDDGGELGEKKCFFPAAGPSIRSH